MKNFLKIQPEDWKREREIGQVSFVIKRAIIFAAYLTPMHLLLNFLLASKDENYRFGKYIITGILTSVGLSVGEWLSLECQYWKNMRKEDLVMARINTEKK